MSDADMFLVRNGNDDGILDLSVGEPAFLQESLSFLKNFNDSSNFKYPQFSGQPSLINEIKKYHGGAYKHIVVANGSQIKGR